MKEKTSLQIRIDDTIYKPLKIIAKREMRSLNAQLEYFLRESIYEYTNKFPHALDSMEFPFDDEDNEE